MAVFMGSIIPELQNRVTHYDVKSRVTTSKILFFEIFRFSTSMRKKALINIGLELVTRDFKQNKLLELLTRKIKKN